MITNIKPDHLNILVKNPNLVETESLEEKVKLLIIRDLLRLNWTVNYKNDRVLISPPDYYDKEIIKHSMSIKRQEIIDSNRGWIDGHIDLARKNLADGEQVLSAKIKPVIEVCETQKQHDLFRIFRYYWSSPYSEYVGRRIKLLIRDASIKHKPVIGIAALGSPIIHIPERDDWVGWSKDIRTENLIYCMDAYVIGALPPYNYLLGGKLISYILASNELRRIYKKKYKDSITKIVGRKANDLACIFTTSLYGKSSQYNRVTYDGRLLYNPIGETKGYGTLHLTQETFASMQELLKQNKILVTNKFGDGPSWRMRVIRAVGDILGFDSDFLLQHSFKRAIYAVPLAENFKAVLNGQVKKPLYYNYPLREVVEYWKTRWLNNRKENLSIINKILEFKRSEFYI